MDFLAAATSSAAQAADVNNVQMLADRARVQVEGATKNNTDQERVPKELTRMLMTMIVLATPTRKAMLHRREYY